MSKFLLTLPLKPIFENEQFVNANASAQIAVIYCAFYILHYNLYNTDYHIKLVSFCGVLPQTFYKHRKTIISILEAVMPKIVEQKQKIRDKGLKASAGLNRVNREKAIKKADFKLAETTEENPAPLMPQLSAKSATLNRQALNAQPTSINRIITKKPDQPRLK